MKIVLDAGHGFNTSGKRTPDGTMREWEFNSDVANLCKTLLEHYDNIQVMFVHDVTGKIDVPLSTRVKVANESKADLYVSIHANAFGNDWNDANGIETFVYKSNLTEAVELASKVQSNLVSMTGLKNRGVKTADFQVLRETKMTAILVECGFMTNRNEAASLKSDAYRIKCAEAIVKGIAEQYNLKKKVVIKEEKYRVITGTFNSKEDAEKSIQKMKDAGIVKYAYVQKEM